MGLFDHLASEEYAVQMSEGYVREAEGMLAARKAAREQAKQNGNYKNSSKCYSSHGKRGNSYDCNVWAAEDLLRQRKKELANAKLRLKEAKKRRQAEAKEAKASSKSSTSSAKSSSSAKSTSKSSTSSSSSSYSSSSYSSSSSSHYDSSSSSKGTLFSSIINNGLDAVQALLEEEKKEMMIKKEVQDYTDALSRKYPIQDVTDTNSIILVKWVQELGEESSRLAKECEKYDVDETKYEIAEKCKEFVDNLIDKGCNKFADLQSEQYIKSIKRRYPIDNASDSDLVKWLPGLLAEIREQDKECKDNKGDSIMYSFYSKSKQGVQTIATNACVRLKELNSSLYYQSEIQELVRQINPRLENGIKRVIRSFQKLAKNIVEKLQGFTSSFNKR